MEHKKKYNALLVLTVISLAASLILSFAPASEACAIGEINEGGCLGVKSSNYNYTLGLQNSYYGIAIFIILTLMIYSQLKNPAKTKEKYINIAITIGAIIAIYFLLLQMFVIKDFCQYCLIVDFSLLISLGIIIADKKLK